MTKTKKIFGRAMLTAMVSLGSVLGAKVTLQPLYSDVRFQPSDKLHAGCTNSADILFAPQGQKATKITMVFYYNPENLEILRILPSSKNGTASSKIEYDKIILEVDNPTFSSSTEAGSIFQIFFKSDIVGNQLVRLGTGSEVITASKTSPLAGTFNLDFAKVPECEPDIVPPSINLIYPKNTDDRIALDQYFIFDIKDIGKGIDKNSVIIHFDGQQYFYGGENLRRNGNYLTFYPGKRIPIDASLDLKILVADQQSYGGANKTESKYTLQSATGMMLSKGINPMIFRKIVQEAAKISASVDECGLLGDLYAKAPFSYQVDLKSIMQKLGCDVNTFDTTLVPDDSEAPAMNTQEKQYRNISVFATLGWILFFIAFTLKLHYMFSYRKHRKINELKK